MEKPRCKVCAARHYNREPHVLEGDDPTVKAKGSAQSSVTKTLTSSITDGSGSVTPGSTKQEKWRGRNAEKYKSQRREYMRTYRQRGKGSQSET